MAKGFTRLLKKGIPFHWDQVSQASFDALKDTLMRASLMYSQNYQNDYFLYLAATYKTIAMVLIQEEDWVKHPIYYLSCNLNDMEVKYSYVNKTALASVQAVQRFCHYILLRKTTVISNCKSMTYILSRQLLGGKYSKWIIILQEFDLEFIKYTSKKSLFFSELLCYCTKNCHLDILLSV